ncbi:TIGR02186 family protein [Pelagibacterium montanilacus]|uniref:TIGR02186 family protein n=1 Tax=Pelagibacterium montanilacus TaxID=2185280 RepID=UPI000F8D466F|nr:TIGR02186 family protein [Pelagibacterium montanilacus]
MVARLVLILALLALHAGPARAQGLIFGTSDPTIWIHSSFTGETITLFGNVEPDVEGTAPEGPFDILVVIRGPVSDRVIRRQSRQFGIMLNADSSLYTGLPGFYRVISSRPIETIIDPEELAERMLMPERQIELASQSTSNAGDIETFNAELLRLLSDANLYRSDERGITFLSPTFFATRVVLPANVPNGSFLAQTFVIKDRDIVTSRSQRFFVQKTGFERFTGEMARSQPLLYGLATVLLALVTGWLGGVLFRR